jgi:hypothetical protein
MHPRVDRGLGDRVAQAVAVEGMRIRRSIVANASR